MKIKVREQVPAGQYRGEYLGTEDVTHEKWGPGWLWRFRITSGKWKGQEVLRTTKDYASKLNSSGKFVAALTGIQSADRWEKLDLDDYIGTECMLIVSESEGGSTRVESFIPDREPGEDDEDAVNSSLAEAAADDQDDT